MPHLALAGTGRAGTRGFYPIDIAGLKLWLKADALALTNDDPVTTWTDASGLGNSFTQATGGNKPTFKTNIANGLPVVRFDGSDDVLTGPDLMSGATAGEVFMVIKLDTDPPAADEQTGFWRFGGSVTEDDHVPYSDGNVYDGWGSSVRKGTGNPTLSLSSAFRLYNVSSASGAWTSRVDGTQHFTTATNTVGFISTPKLGQSINAVHCFDGDMAECIIYDSVLSGGNRDSVEAYIAAKYGLTIA